ncbi:MAG: trigger factor [Candidatus Kapabacteria bacterium]|nr:trigger factor [Candidatus Kapabacteria bacterium]
MEKQIIKSEGCDREIQFTIGNAELKPYFDNAYRELIPKLEMKGFRKGKVPMHLVKQMYGKAVEEDTAQEIITDFFNKTISEDQLRVLGEPELISMDRNDAGMVAVVGFDQYPEFTVSDYRGISIDEPVHNVSDEEIDAEIQKICLKDAKIEYADQVTDYNFVVTVSYRKIDPDTNAPIADQEPMRLPLFLANPEINLEARDAYLNAKIGDTFIGKFPVYSPSAETESFQITVDDVQKIVPQEFNDDYVQLITEGRLQTTEELNTELGYSLQMKWNERSREEMDRQITNHLLTTNDFPLPGRVISKLQNMMISDYFEQQKKNKKPLKNLTDEEIEIFKKNAESSIKWSLLQNEIIKHEGLAIDDDDLESHVETEVARSGKSFESVKKALKEDEQFIRYLENKKLLEFILDFAITNEIPFKEYYEKYGMNTQPEYNDNFDDDYSDEDDDYSDDHDHEGHDHHHHDHDHDHEGHDHHH